MANTYTPSSNTMVGQQMQQSNSMVNALGSIPGISPQASQALTGYQGAQAQANALSASIPGYTANQQVANNAAASLPQAAGRYGNEADLYKMFVADHQLAQQYMRPDVNTPGSTVQQAPDYDYGAYGITNSLPGMTNASLQQGFQGFTNPLTAELAADEQGKAILGALDNIMKFYDYNSGKANSQTQIDSANRKKDADFMSGQADSYLNLYKILADQAASNQSKADSEEGMIQGLSDEIKQGATLAQMMRKYTKLDSDTILNTYNRINASTKRGPAKETAAQLNKLYGTTLSEADKKRGDEEEANKTEMEDALIKIKAAEDALSKSGSGLIFQDIGGIRAKAPTFAGGYTKDQSETNNAFSDLNSQLFEIAGKAFTGSERKLLEAKVLGIDKNANSNLAQLRKAREAIERKIGKTSGAAPATTSGKYKIVEVK